jgi:hypothetical protein
MKIPTGIPDGSGLSPLLPNSDVLVSLVIVMAGLLGAAFSIWMNSDKGTMLYTLVAGFGLGLYANRRR